MADSQNEHTENINRVCDWLGWRFFHLTAPGLRDIIEVRTGGLIINPLRHGDEMAVVFAACAEAEAAKRGWRMDMSIGPDDMVTFVARCNRHETQHYSAKQTLLMAVARAKIAVLAEVAENSRAIFSTLA